MDPNQNPDDRARAAAPVPSEPWFVERTTTGIVKWWRGDKGYGAIATAVTSPWDIWAPAFGVLRPASRWKLCSTVSIRKASSTSRNYSEGSAQNSRTARRRDADDRL